MDKALTKAATIALRDCMKLVEGEQLLVVTDTHLIEIGRALVEAGRGLGAVSTLMEITPLSRNGEEPPRSVSEAMLHSDVVVAPTSKSLSHTTARRNACANGARVGTMPGITIDTMVRGLSADYYAIADRTKRITALLTAADSAHITTEAGTDLTMPLRGIDAIASTGLMHEKGSFGNLPSGEAYMMPVEGGSEGIVVVDGSMAGVGDLAGKTPITIRIEGGHAVEITGGPEADLLRSKLEPLGRPAHSVAELGVGTNDVARIIGNILEDEKVMGTIHVALGNNMSMGGTVDVPIHLDGIVRDPTVTLDGKLLMENGKLLID